MVKGKIRKITNTDLKDIKEYVVALSGNNTCKDYNDKELC